MRQTHSPLSDFIALTATRSFIDRATSPPPPPCPSHQDPRQWHFETSSAPPPPSPTPQNSFSLPAPRSADPSPSTSAKNSAYNPAPSSAQTPSSPADYPARRSSTPPAT